MNEVALKSGTIHKKQSPSGVFTGIVVGLLVAFALFIRIIPPYYDIFVGEWIKFASNDAYFYMRLVDNMVANFPHLMTVDPYLVYPNGESVGAFYLFARLIASVSWIVGLGAPTQQIVDLVGVYTPAVLGAMVVIPIYFIGKELAGRWCGIISAGLIAIMPGEFLGRSIVGFTDHHVAEVLFSAITILFLAVALKQENFKKRIVFSLLAGVFLGIYMLTWIGGLLMVFIIALYFALQFVIDYLKHRPIGYLIQISTIAFLVAGLMFLPTVRYSFYYVVMLGVVFLLMVLGGLSRILPKMKPRNYLLTVAGIGMVGIGLLYITNPLLIQAMVGMFVHSSTQSTTIEMQPLLFPLGSFTLAVAWGNFGLALYVALISFVILAYGVAKTGDSTKTLIIVWSFVILAMALGQRRFAYYLAVNAAILTGYLSWLALKWAGLESLSIRKKKGLNYTSGINIGLVAVFVFLVAFLPNIPSAVSVASQARYAPSDAWVSSLDWLRENSPEPFPNDPDIAKYYFDDTHWASSPYYAYGAIKIEGEAEYGVLAWWDYGYWITRIAHRVPNSNPSQNPIMQTDVADFFTSQDESSAGNLGAKYVVIDFDTALSKFWAITRYAGRNESEYFGTYYVANENQIVPVQLFYPDYYHSLSTRLYNFNGMGIMPHNITVMTYEQRANNGVPYNFITDAKQFSTYGEVEAFLADNPSGNWNIVSNNPFVSPVPLEAVNDYTLVYASSEKKPLGDAGEISEVKIFERR